MKSKVFYLLIVLLLAVAGCADNSGSSSNGGTQSAGDGTLGGQTTANIKEYFTAGSGSTAAVNAKVLYRDNSHRNDFEQDDDIEGVRLFFRYEDNTTSEAVYNINGQEYHAIVDDMVYAGHNWIGLELEQLYNVNGRPDYAASRNDRIGLVNIKTGEVIVMENQVFSRCQDLETLEVLGNNKAYFICENSAYTLDLGTKEIVQVGASKNDKFDDSFTVLFADGTGVYQMEREYNRPNDIRFIDDDSVVTVNGDLTELPVKYFKDENDNILYFKDNRLYNLSLEDGVLAAADLNLELPATALGPVRNEDDATAKFISRQVMVSDTAFYVYDVVADTITETPWNNIDFNTMRPFIENSEDAEEHIFFGENGIAYVYGRSIIKYIPYVENAEPKTVALPEDINIADYEIDDITLIGDVLYFQLEGRGSERETFYRADVSQDIISAEEYTGDKTIMKVIDIDITVTTPEDNTGSDTGDNNDNQGNTGSDTGSNNGNQGNTGSDTGDNNGNQGGNTGSDTGSNNGNQGGNTDTGSNGNNTETPVM